MLTNCYLFFSQSSISTGTRYREMKAAKLCVVLLILSLFHCVVNCANVLLALSFSSQSHKNIMDPILEGLMNKGHEVTVVSFFPASKHPKGVTTVELKSIREIMKSLNVLNYFEYSKKSPWEIVLKMNEILNFAANVTFSDPDFKTFIQSGQKFDVVLLDGILNDYMTVIPYFFNAPGVFLSSSRVYPQTAWNLDIPSAPAVHPVSLFPFPSPMSFKHRLLNIVVILTSIFNRNYLFYPELQKLVEEHFPGAPPLLQLEKNISLVLANTFPSLTGPEPTMPYVVDIGGIHCRPPKNLPKDLEDFVNSSGEDGFIIFSLGSVTAGTLIPEDVRQKMLKVFAAQKQKVIWKYEGEMADAPKTVKLVKWLPQQDLLGHPKCKLFITHGGLLSLQEAVYHSVPVLSVPLSADQYGNAQKTVSLGLGHLIYWDDFTLEEIMTKIESLLHDPKFKTRMKEMSELFKDRPMDIVQTGVYWVEYVMRTKGARHLKTKAGEFNFAQYFLLDVIAFVAIILVTIVAVLAFLLRSIFRFVCRKVCGQNCGKKKDASTKKTN